MIGPIFHTKTNLQFWAIVHATWNATERRVWRRRAMWLMDDE